MFDKPFGAAEYIALSSVVVAVFAMIATFWQAHLARRHSRLSVKPHLDWGVKRFPKAPYELILLNNGLGPAIVKLAIFRIDDEVYIGDNYNVDWPESMRNKIPEMLLEDMEWTTFGSETPIRNGDRISLLKISNIEPNSNKAQAAFQFLDRFGVEIQYESIYKESFTLEKKPKVISK